MSRPYKNTKYRDGNHGQTHIRPQCDKAKHREFDYANQPNIAANTPPKFRDDRNDTAPKNDSHHERPNRHLDRPIPAQRAEVGPSLFTAQIGEGTIVFDGCCPDSRSTTPWRPAFAAQGGDKGVSELELVQPWQHGAMSPRCTQEARRDRVFA